MAKVNKVKDVGVRDGEFAVPAAAGWRMPAEWERHEGTWLAWPHNDQDWPGKFAPIPWIFADIVRLIARGERVHMFVPPSVKGPKTAEIRDILERTGVAMERVELIPQATDRIWTRDSGPIFLRRGRVSSVQCPVPGDEKGCDAARGLALVDFKFNAWAKYDNSTNDDLLPSVVAKRTKIPAFTAFGVNDAGELQRFVLEGGSIDVNGAGCVLTTEECLLSKVQQRNPGFSRQRIEQTLCGYLGVEKVLWLERGIAGDDTHGHIDDTARFVSAGTVVCCVEENKGDDNYGPMRENVKRLKRMRDAKGKPLEVVELPLPEPVVFDGQRLPASYANFYICNAGVLVPVFNDPNDSAALKVLEGCFTGRAVIPVYCRDLVWGLGTLHCMTQQQPGEC